MCVIERNALQSSISNFRFIADAQMSTNLTVTGKFSNYLIKLNKSLNKDYLIDALFFVQFKQLNI